MSGNDEKAVFELAADALIRASLSIDHQLTQSADTQPVAVMLEIARKEAAGAILPLVQCDPTDATQIRELQGKIRRYQDMVRWLSDIVTSGMWLKARVEEAERESLINILNPEQVSEYSEGEESEYADAEQG